MRRPLGRCRSFTPAEIIPAIVFEIMATSNKRRTSLMVVLTTFGFLLPVGLYLWLISADAVDMLRADQWFDVRLIRHSFNGTLRFGMLWGQHGENRIFFQNLITLLLAHVFHFNVIVEDYVSAVLLIGAMVLVVLTHRRRSPSTPWIAYWPVAIILLSVAQYGGTLFGFAIGWYLIILALSIALFFLDRRDLTWIALSAAVAAGVLGSFSSLQGLFIWPVGLVLLLQRARGRWLIAGWVAAGFATTGIYFYNWDAGQGSVSYAVHHVLDTLRFFFFTVGDVIGVQLPNSPSVAQYGVFALGVAIVGIGIWSILSCGLRVDVSSARPIGVVLICFGLLFAAAVAGARTSLGLSNASFPLYVTFDVLILLGSYLILIDRSQHSASNASPNIRWLPGMTIAVSVLVGLQFLLGTDNGISYARSYHDFELTGAVVTAKIQRAPDGLVENQLGAGYETAGFIRQMTDFLRANHLSLFSTAAIDWYAKQSLPVNRTAPTTVIEKPADGAVLHGDVFLVASAWDYFGVTKVQFVMRRDNQPPRVVSKGVVTDFGWLGAWDTRTVPDGAYSLRSVAYAPGGLMSTSSSVVVRVVN